jgi:hypothetical protein
MAGRSCRDVHFKLNDFQSIELVITGESTEMLQRRKPVC